MEGGSEDKDEVEYNEDDETNNDDVALPALMDDAIEVGSNGQLDEDLSEDEDNTVSYAEL